MRILAFCLLVGLLFLSACSPSEAEIRRQNAEASEAEARAAQAWVAAHTDQQAAGSLVQQKIIINLAFAFAFGVMVVGIAASAAMCLYNFSVGFSERTRNQLVSIHPNARGIYPLQIKQGRDPNGHPFVIVHDPNRQVGATTIYHLEAGQQPKQINPPASENAQVEITANAQRQAILSHIPLLHPRTITAQDIIPTTSTPLASPSLLPEVKASNLDASHVERLLAEVMEDDEP